jgi:hypothetical protein
VEREPAALANLNCLVPHRDPLPLRIHLHPKGRSLAIDPNATVLDQLLSGAAGRDSCTGQRPLKSHFTHDSAST